jgi:hypothetical protein
MTATFMTEGNETVTLGKDLEFVILHHGVGEEVVGDLVELLLIGSIDLDFNRFANADGTDSLEAEMLHRSSCGNTSRIENRGLRHDGDDSFHEEKKIGPSSPADKSKGEMESILRFSFSLPE